MKSLLRDLRRLRADYRRVKSPADDLADTAAAIAFTLFTLECGLIAALTLGGY